MKIIFYFEKKMMISKNSENKKQVLSSIDGTNVFRLSLGGAGIGSSKDSVFFQGPVPEPQAVETVLFALENGINLLDTSPFYGNSEKKIGTAIREYGKRSSFLLSTKVGTHPRFPGYSKDKILRSIDNSLRLLQTDYLDIVHIHDPAAHDLHALLNGNIETLLNLKEEGVIRALGLGVRDHELHRMFISSGYADIIMPYLDYNLLRTNAAGLMDEARKNNIDIMLGSPLCMGLLSGTDPATLNISHYEISKEVPLETAKQMYAWCLKHKVNLMALNYQFILDHPAVTTILAGASSKKEVKESLDALNENILPEIRSLFYKEFKICNYSKSNS
jgi:aryl-alcohol dehydrogenase-like predicted oxidoreductase